MGATGWEYVVPYHEDVERALLDLQAELIAREEVSNSHRPEDADRYDIRSLEDLRAAQATEEFWEVGTHSILDIDQVIEAGQQDVAGAIAPLSAERTRRCLGSDRPSREDFERARAENRLDWEFPRWSGRYVVLYRDGRPDGIGFWGFSGD